MKKLKFLTYGMMALMLVFAVACDGDDGATGPAGTAGTNGTNGTNGTDGNANVTVISVPNGDVSWTSGSYLGTTTNTFSITDTAVNQDIIDHGTVLGYMLLFGNWYALPFEWQNNTGSLDQHILFNYALDTIVMHAYQTNGVLNPGATEYRFMLITDNTVGKTNTNALSQLEAAGVDVNNYEDVMDYYGLEY
ncbi:MAG: hypothetical protein COA67_02400 [Lutibacter sp.]|nr:MAG: hypothetical protein COA67_02400 [Lutibacter sp.]